MKPPKRKQNEKNFDNNQPRLFKKDNVKNNPAGKEANTNNGNECQTVKSEIIKVVILEDNRKNKQAVVANIISFISLIVAIIGFIFAYLLFEQTKNQLIKENQSFLQIKDFKLSSLDIGQPMKVDFIRINTGNLPIIVKSAKIGYTFSENGIDTNPFETPLGDTINEVYSNIFVSKEFPMEGQFLSRENIPIWVIQRFDEKKSALFFYGEVKYENVADKSSYVYVFNIKINSDNPTHSIAIYYDTKPINNQD